MLRLQRSLQTLLCVVALLLALSWLHQNVQVHLRSARPREPSVGDARLHDRADIGNRDQQSVQPLVRPHDTMDGGGTESQQRIQPVEQPQVAAGNESGRAGVCSQEARFHRLYAACGRTPTEADIDAMSEAQIRGMASQVLVAEKLQALVCLHFKVAWTSIKTILLNNTLPEEEVPYMNKDSIQWRRLREKHNITQLNDPRFSLADQRHRLKHYFKFFFVRHPLDRIYSGYYDKIVVERQDQHGRYYRRLIPAVLKVVLPPEDAARADVETVDVPFADVLRFVARGGYDQHFQGPYINKCSPCTLKYDYIGKVETFDHDMGAIIDRQFPARRGKNTRENIAAAAGEHPDTAAPGGVFHKRLVAYEAAPAETVTAVARIYARDFTHFGYSYMWEGDKFVASCQGMCC